MPSIESRSRRTRARSPQGSQLLEFGAALIILVGLVFLPLLDLAIVPIRWMMAQELVNDYSRQLALCESFSQSFTRMESSPSLTTRLKQLGGITVQSLHLQLKITRVLDSGESIAVDMPGKIPPEWLPDGSKAPCSYCLVMQVNSLLSPALLLPANGNKVPGVNAPFPVILKAAYEWENFARNPATGKYYLNE